MTPITDTPSDHLPDTITGTLTACDGTRLFYREWPVERPRAILVLVHGLGEHGARYAHVARRLNGLGIAVRVADQRGHGSSGGPRGVLRAPNDFIEDLKLVLDDYAAAHATTPFLLGHSMGGLIAARFATGKFSNVRGLVLSSPALALRLSGFETTLLALAWRFFPTVPIRRPAKHLYISHDPQVLAGAHSDALNHRMISARLLKFMLDARRHVHEDAQSFDAPVLLLVAGDDRIVDPNGSRDFYELLPARDRKLIWYEGAYHEVFNETSAATGNHGKRVLDDLCNWLEAHLPNYV